MKAAFLFALLIWVTLAQAADKNPVIESITGDQVVAVLTLDQQRFAKAGEEIQYWDKILTSPRSACKVRYPDGSTIVIGRDSRVEILPKMEGTQYNQLSYGVVRAQVAKEEKPSAKQTMPRFVIRTKTATMGVRGTDFVASMNGTTGQASLHTLEGVVDFAASDAQLMSGQAMSVSAGQASSMGPDTVAPQLETFVPENFEVSMRKDSPELVSLADPPRVPSNDSKSDEQKRDEWRKEDDDKAQKAREEQEAANRPPRLKVLSFGVGAIVVSQDNKNLNPGGTTVENAMVTSAELSWMPSFRLIGPFSLKGHLSVFPLKEKQSGSTFMGMAAGLLLSFTLLDPLILEAGLSKEEWTGGHSGGGGYPCGSSANTGSTGTTASTSTATCGGDSGGEISPRVHVIWRFNEKAWLHSLYAGLSSFESSNSYGSKVIEGHAGVGIQF